MVRTVSVPDEVFDRVEQSAAELGISRSQFFVRAARKYLAELAAQSLTVQIDEAVEAGGTDDSHAEAANAGRRVLTAKDDW